MPRQTSRKLEVFAIHAHFGEGQQQAVNYRRLFQSISGTMARQRMVTVSSKSIAIPEFRKDQDLVILTCVEGEEGNPLVFNFVNATERIEQLERGEKLATKTHCAIDIARREAVIEFNHRGAKAADVATALQDIGSRLTGWGDLEIELTPVIDQSFLQAINAFSRIRIATLKMVRPNPGWTDHVDNLTALASESQGHVIEVTVNAERAKSLNKRGGIMGFIRHMVGETLPSFKAAKVTGVREGEDAETTVTLANHIAHQRVIVELTVDGHVNDRDINNKIVRFLESRNPRARQ
ncbi:MAG TPA: hypothetical protein VLB46_19325 [Pyrinomonadaceae bacterium]|nr:hypothetical protein [Pyrinomonadaceae bacterium]